MQLSLAGGKAPGDGDSQSPTGGEGPGVFIYLFIKRIKCTPIYDYRNNTIAYRIYLSDKYHIIHFIAVYHIIPIEYAMGYTVLRRKNLLCCTVQPVYVQTSRS